MSIPPAPLTPTVSHLQLRSSAIGSAFVGTSSSVGRTRQSKIPCLGLSSSFLFERVWVTQGLPCIPPGVALDKTPSTSKWKFTIGRLTSGIFNPSSLMLTELQKSPTSFDSFEKDVSLRSESREKELDCWDTWTGSASPTKYLSNSYYRGHVPGLSYSGYSRHALRLPRKGSVQSPHSSYPHSSQSHNSCVTVRATYRSAPTRSRHDVMTRCTACWAQQARLSGGKRQLQLVLRYDVVVWEKLRRPHNSGWAYPVRPGNEVSYNKTKI